MLLLPYNKISHLILIKIHTPYSFILFSNSKFHDFTTTRYSLFILTNKVIFSHLRYKNILEISRLTIIILFFYQVDLTRQFWGRQASDIF